MCSLTYMFSYISVFFSVILAIEIVWLVIGGMWISRYYRDCPISTAKEAMLGRMSVLQINLTIV